MWLIIKYKSKEYQSFKKNILKKIDNDIIIYRPKIKKQISIINPNKYLEKNILGNYVMVYSKIFLDHSVLKKISTLVGVSYILDGFIQSQKQISKFIDYCKIHEDINGFLKQSFFNFKKNQKGFFINGPFINYIFDIIDNQKNKMKLLVNNKKILISKKNFLQVKPV